MFSGTVIDSMWPWLISVGDNVTLSSNVTILAHDASTNVVQCGTKLGRVKIGSNVFIGTGSIILCNVTIGDNVVIGAGSVVTKDVLSNTVVYGNPAKPIKDVNEILKEKVKNNPNLR
jgi:maltose O-acetyltransferase